MSVTKIRHESTFDSGQGGLTFMRVQFTTEFDVPCGEDEGKAKGKGKGKGKEKAKAKARSRQKAVVRTWPHTRTMYNSLTAARCKA